MAGQVGSVGINVVADTTGVQVGMVQAATISERELKRVAKYVVEATKSVQNMQRVTKDAANANSYEKMAAGAEKLRGAHAGVNRELLVLAHELSQGNYSKFGGSLLVLAERTNALEFALSGAGAATLGVAGAAIGFVAAVAAGAIEADKFAKNLQLTGNFAATTSEQIGELAKAQAHMTGQSVSSARGSLEAAAGSGLFGPAAVASVARAMGDYERITSASAEEALKKFEGLENGVAKWAESENRSMHFISLAEYEHIKALEESGQKEQAAIETVNALAQALESRGTPALGYFARAWHFVTDEAGAAIDAMKNIGRPTDSLVAGIAKIEQQMALVKQANTANPAGAAEYLQNLSIERSRLERLQFRANEHRSDSSTNAAAAQAGIDAKNYTDGVLKSAKALSARTEELRKWDDAVKAQAAAGSPLSAADQAAGRSEIEKKYAAKVDHSADARVNEYANLMAGVKAFNAQTELEIETQRKLTDAEKYSIRAHEELEKAGKKLTTQQRASISAAIDEAAAHRTAAELLARVHPVEGAQATFRNSELEAQGQVNEALRQQILLHDELIAKKAAEDNFNSSFSNGTDKAMQAYVKNAENAAAQGEKFFIDAAQGMTDAFVHFAQTGKLSLKGMFQSIESDLIRMQVQKGFAALFGGGGAGGSGGVGSAAGLLGTLASGNASFGAAGTAFANAIDFFPPFANGLDYVPYDGFPAILHEGEKVTTRQDANTKRSGQAVHIDMRVQNQSFGAGVSASEVAQQVQTGRAQTEAHMRRLLANGSIRA
jgi:lambda family phage tail tape measure protein